MKLSPGEQMIWAAAYVDTFKEIKRPPPGICGPNEKRGEWEKEKTLEAVELASAAVEYSRECASDLFKGWGRDSETYKMWYQIHGGRLGNTASD